MFYRRLYLICKRIFVLINGVKKAGCKSRDSGGMDGEGGSDDSSHCKNEETVKENPNREDCNTGAGWNILDGSTVQGQESLQGNKSKTNSRRSRDEKVI